MRTCYFLIQRNELTIVRYSKGVTEVFRTDTGWVECEAWYNRIFFGDFTDYEEITEKEADLLIQEHKRDHTSINQDLATIGHKELSYDEE